jgi:mono/diheme cytochrome c family protein
MSITRMLAKAEAHARSVTPAVLMLFAVFATAEARAQGPSDNSWIAPERASHRANPLLPTTDVLKHGKELFQRDCEQCHGKAGRGDGPQSFSLEKHPADLASERVQSQADGAFYWKMTEGRGVMPKATLGDKDKWSVILYLRTLAITNP